MRNKFLSLQQAASNAGVAIIMRSFSESMRCVAEHEKALASMGLQDRLDECTDLTGKIETGFSRLNFDKAFAELITQFGRLVGELEFAAIAYKCGLALQPVQSKDKESRSKTQAPDFVCGDDPCVFFEVKTLARVDTANNILELINESRKNRQAMEAEIASGKRIVTSITEDQPYGAKPYEKGSIRGVVEALSLKVQSNLKSGQFANGKTFLVVNLLDLPLYTTESEQLRPVFWSDAPPVSSPQSGALWTVAFGKHGNLYFFPPKFEGEAGVEGVVDFEGVLHSASYIAGIVWVVHSLSGSPRLMASIRSADRNAYSEGVGTLWLNLIKLVDNCWNDELDSNGWALQAT